MNEYLILLYMCCCRPAINPCKEQCFLPPCDCRQQPRYQQEPRCCEPINPCEFASFFGGAPWGNLQPCDRPPHPKCDCPPPKSKCDRSEKSVCRGEICCEDYSRYNPRYRHW